MGEERHSFLRVHRVKCEASRPGLVLLSPYVKKVVRHFPPFWAEPNHDYNSDLLGDISPKISYIVITL